MVSRKGLYSLAASLVTSLAITLVFYLLAVQKAATSADYTQIDIYAGMAYVFILSKIVSASIWPGAIGKMMRQ